MVDNITKGSNNIIDGLKNILEICLVLFKIFLSICESAFRLVFPATEKPIKGEIVLVTGAGHGIGKELALQYATLNAIVVCLDINGQTNNDTVAEIKKKKKLAFGYMCDVTNQNQLTKTLEKVQKEVGDITILINNAGVLQSQSLLKMTVEDIQRAFEINIISHFRILQIVLPPMIKNNHGHIVAIGSGLSLVGIQNLTTYCSSKFAVRGLMKSLEDELRLNQNNKIKVTTILPGFVDTDICTNYTIRNSTLTIQMSPSRAAQDIISAQRRNITEVSIPKYILPFFSLANYLPNRAMHVLIDFFEVKFQL